MSDNDVLIGYHNPATEHDEWICISDECARRLLADLIQCYEPEITRNLEPIVGIIESCDKLHDADATARRFRAACYITKEIRSFGG